LTHLFPGAEMLADADLTGAGLTGARIAAIHSFARAVASGSVRLDRSRTLEDQVASLVEVPGLGPWTAQYIALRMGEPDAFPSTDLGLRRALEALVGKAVTSAAVTEFAERWHPCRAHAAIHLWLTPTAHKLTPLGPAKAIP
jgi:AraC family transcriptional regulator of adaptative response / DNA-3-methyladenine glycosylase II